MLYSQGFSSAQVLASKVVPLFELCQQQLSSKSHYDFGLRALKSVLVSAGNMKRQYLQTQDASKANDKDWEQEILVQSIHDTVAPKLV